MKLVRNYYGSVMELAVCQLGCRIIMSKDLAEIITHRMKKNLQKSAILFGTKSNTYLQINRPIFAYSWLFLPIFAYLRICNKSPQIYFTFAPNIHAYFCLFFVI